MGWQNRIDEAVLSGGSWVATLPLNNLKVRQVQQVARTTDAALASTLFMIDLQKPRAVGVVALIVHNISVSGRVRVRGSLSDTFDAAIYDSDWMSVWPAGIIPMSLRNWEESNFWLGTLTEEQRAGYQAPYIHQLPSQQSLRYWMVEIDDESNPEGYVHIGRAFISPVWTPEMNFDHGSGLRYEDPTEIETSMSGAEYFGDRSKPRVFDCALSWLSSDEAYTNALDLQRLAGIRGEVLVVPDGSDIVNLPKTAFIARLKSLGRITKISFNRHAVPFEFKELL